MQLQLTSSGRIAFSAPTKIRREILRGFETTAISLNLLRCYDSINVCSSIKLISVLNKVRLDHAHAHFIETLEKAMNILKPGYDTSDSKEPRDTATDK